MSPASLENARPARLDPTWFAGSVLQLGLLMLAIRALELERSLGLVAITPVIFLGFCIHAWLPAAWKLPGFLALSLAAILLVLGAVPGAILVGIGLLLLGLCHLPVRLAWRLVLIGLAGACLASLRIGWIASDWAPAVLPVLGAMFMFRLVIYLYDEHTDERPASLWMRLSYFFLLPNVCFLLFPVVDYRTFRRTYYEKPAQEIHQRGIEWILRGIVHLLLYRVVYFYLTPAAGEIQDLLGVARFVLSSFLLYLRISGHFHLIVGLLHLFGFHLPETNHRYLLATSFTDCWRRINVYWTEFMKKIVYYPVFMRLRNSPRGGTLFAMIGATAVAFVATWLLHAYQWFWLQGAFPLASDGLFWGLAGGLAIGATVREARRDRKRKLGPARPSWTDALRRSLQAAVVLALICVIWSVWCAGSLEQWLAILGAARQSPPAQVLLLLGLALGFVLLGTVAQRAPHAWSPRGARPRLVASTAGALLLAALGLEPVRAACGSSFAVASAPIAGDYLNVRDRERMLAGYYDRLIEREGFGGRASERLALARADEDWEDPESSHIFVERDGVKRHELVPSMHTTYLAAPFETNRYGMRDREYAIPKPPNTVRIALLGTCYEMGAGVANHETWEAVAEALLNAEVAPRTGNTYEILNFAVVGYGLLQQLSLLKAKVERFAPDVVVLSNHYVTDVKYLVRVFTGEETPSPETVEILAGLGLQAEPGLDQAAARRHVGPYQQRIELQGLRRISAHCREIGAQPVLLVVPLVDQALGSDESADRRVAARIAAAGWSGFRVLNMGAAFDGRSFDSLTLRAWSHLPSRDAHRLLADALFELLRAEIAAETLVAKELE